MNTQGAARLQRVHTEGSSCPGQCGCDTGLTHTGHLGGGAHLHEAVYSVGGLQGLGVGWTTHAVCVNSPVCWRAHRSSCYHMNPAQRQGETPWELALVF